MIIQRMRATFGRLEDRELSLRPGLNIVSGGNETGKSTWLAFLLAMLYGIDTKERSRSDHLPDKLRFQPWNGKPMAGTMELTDDDKSITLERTSRAAPMGDFRAWDTASGTPLDTMSGQSCGKELLDVEASVYTRSGFLRQQGAAVTADAQLEKRLSSLVTTGSEEYSYTELDEKLKKLQTSLRHNRTGALPQAEDRREALQQRLAELGQKQQELAAVEAELHSLRQQQAQVREALAGLDALEQLARQKQADQAEESLRAAQAERERLEALCEALPEAGVLEAPEAEVKHLQAELRQAEEDAKAQVPLPPDPLFEGMDAQQVRDKMAADSKTVQETNQTPPPPSQYRAMLWLLGTLVGAALVFFGSQLVSSWMLLGGLVLTLSTLGLWLWRFRTLNHQAESYAAQQKAVEDLLASYETDSESGITERGTRWLQELARRAEPTPLELLGQKREALLERLQALHPACATLEQAEEFFRQAAENRQSLAQAKLLEQVRQEHLDGLRAALGSPVEPIPNPERFADCDREAETARLEGLEKALEASAAKAAMLTGAMGQMGDPLILNAELEQLEGEIARMEERYAALQLARTTLTQADEALRARFAPLLCRRTGELFSQLTGGAYDRVQLDRTMRVTVRPTGSTVYRSLAYLSGGTVDQLYLALRLAICELLLPKAPIILDDALVFFDDTRAALALETLREMGKTRQILLFTSQTREKRILDELSARP